MTGPPTTHQLTRRDEAAAVASLVAAFAEYPLFPPLCPDAKRRPQVVAAFCRFLFRMAADGGGAFGSHDRTAVVCAWPPSCEWPGLRRYLRAGGLSFLWQLGWRGTRFLTRMERDFDEARAKHVPGPHWYVQLLGVRPEWQGRGLSRAVLQPIFEAADRDRVPVYLETIPESNVAIYRTLGFTLVGHSKLCGGLPNWELRRDPK